MKFETPWGLHNIEKFMEGFGKTLILCGGFLYFSFYLVGTLHCRGSDIPYYVNGHARIETYEVCCRYVWSHDACDK